MTFLITWIENITPNIFFSEANILNISPIRLYRRTSLYISKVDITNYILIG